MSTFRVGIRPKISFAISKKILYQPSTILTMSRQFSNQVEIQVHDPLITNFKHYFTSSDVIFNETSEDTSQGVFYQQSLSVIIDRSDCPELLRRAPLCPMVVKLDDSSNIYTWGDSNNPVRCVITVHLQKCELQMSRNSTIPLLM